MSKRTAWTLVLTIALVAGGVSFGYPGYGSATAPDAPRCPYGADADSNATDPAPAPKVCPYSGARSKAALEGNPGDAESGAKCPYSGKGGDDATASPRQLLTAEEKKQRV